jgi:hypothetical protein
MATFSFWRWEHWLSLRNLDYAETYSQSYSTMPNKDSVLKHKK